MKKSVLQTIKSAFNLSYLALIVLFCFAISTSFMSINYVAKYLSTDGGFDGARVAKFEVSSLVPTEQNEDFVLSYDKKSAIYSFSVTTDSDVAVEYDVVLEFPTALSSAVTLTLDDKSPDKAEGLAYTFSDVGTFAMGNSTNEHTLKFVASEFDFAESWSNVSVKVVARQID